jgi:hypothetical protein
MLLMTKQVFSFLQTGRDFDNELASIVALFSLKKSFHLMVNAKLKVFAGRTLDASKWRYLFPALTPCRRN